MKMVIAVFFFYILTFLKNAKRNLVNITVGWCFTPTVRSSTARVKIVSYLHHPVPFMNKLSSTANATFFFLSSFELVNYLKTFVPNQHQNDLKIFVCYQIRGFSVHARNMSKGTKMHFPCRACAESDS